MNPLSETEFLAVARPELVALTKALDALGEDVDAELADDILTVDLAGGTRVVINRHGAARQIWMAAQHTAWHFDFDADAQRWTAKKSGDELWQTVSAVLTRTLGRAIVLKA